MVAMMSRRQTHGDAQKLRAATLRDLPGYLPGSAALLGCGIVGEACCTIGFLMSRDTTASPPQACLSFYTTYKPRVYPIVKGNDVKDRYLGG
jgi:hypothetical protein